MVEIKKKSLNIIIVRPKSLISKGKIIFMIVIK